LGAVEQRILAPGVERMRTWRRADDFRVVARIDMDELVTHLE
jgi:hypothetical protein